MKSGDDPLSKLGDLSDFLEHPGTLEENLAELAAMTARILNAESCSIMLLGEADEEARLRVAASFGPLPEAAFQEAAKVGEGIAGHVVRTGQALLVDDIDQSPFAAQARHPRDPRKSMLVSPIPINRRIIGVVNATQPTHERPFGPDDLNLLNIVALFVGKSIQVIQLQNVLGSRLAQIALAQEEGSQASGGVFGDAVQNPDQMAKIVAKSFYAEMTRAGFSPNHIINAASEIISLLSKSLQKHRSRITR